ncbi:MAG TPA: acetamidase/formamidase family protein [Bryobacteraceae bacterium]|nr:acetamidase/formamidase family protein [Bryobacteraceae bacterium]
MRFLWLSSLILAGQICSAADISGAWVAEVTSFGEPQYARVALQTAGSKVAGSWGEWKVEGTINGSQVSFSIADPDGRPLGSLNGAPSGAGFTGGGNLAAQRRNGGAAERQQVDWKLTRPAQPPPGGPKTWDFEPRVFYSYYSAANPPALHIFPGDTVRTWTVDAGGISPKLERLSRGGDATTGPFYIEGALPGDTLVVKLKRVRINRDSAREGNRINGKAVTSAYAAAAKYSPDFNSEWKLDAEKGTATMLHPTDRMKDFTVKIVPMLGCLAVAPPGDEILRGTDLGNFGGNMDYNHNGEGTTLYFPVFHPGALFVLGDGHAAMGDGELTGSALETSMNVEFTVDVIKGYASTQPRADDGEYLISFGIGGSIPESIQNATTQLVEWLKKDYRLNDNEVAVLLGTVLKYDITEMVDPKYNVVAKVPKSALASFR